MVEMNEKGQILVEVARWSWLYDPHLIGTLQSEFEAVVVDSYRLEDDVQVVLLERDRH